MCGIAGIYNLDGAPVDVHVLTRMTDVQRHRGPDDQGFGLFSLRAGRSTPCSPSQGSADSGLWEGGLGVNRLSILDLSLEGHQPMATADGSVLIAYNGETYNAFDLRPGLEDEGVRFRSRTDTEVLLYLYQRHGLEEMLRRLNGMFAFCLVDLREARLYLVRDRLGVKPLYWWSNGRVLLFASELKALLEHPAFAPELEPTRLDEHFLFRYEAGNGCLLKGVRQLEPGQWLSLKDQRLTTGKYWRVPDSDSAIQLGRDETADRLEAHLERSVRMQLLSDVKVGCQLSGGVDSSLVTLLAARHSPGSLDGFSIVFDDRQVSEEAWIDEAAGVAGVDYHKYTLDGHAFTDRLEAATWHMDQPLNHPNSVGIFYLAEQARRHITVFLTGEGADELFGGYTRFLYATLRPRIQPWARLLGWLPYIGERLHTRFNGQPADGVDWFILQSAFLDPAQFMALRPDARLEEVLASRRAIFEQSSGDHLARCLNYELRTYLVDLLVRQDKMTMAHSIENRVPYLDHELVEFVRSLPPSRLVSDRLARWRPRTGNTKVLLKDVARRHFRARFVYRSKEGFPLPLQAFFLSAPFRSVMEERLLPGIRKRGVTDAKVVGRWWKSLLQGEAQNVEALWICAAFELWAQRFLDHAGAGSVVPARPPSVIRT
ncbi:MAG: asparagine synthase (glutamine-hydrolyzing) [Acidobacteria bacterium RIFCSPLOWO2_12_FULL_66_21]|nr:MAG: asparagine synthase (glutamine-hydrolyzing) [Acidobacteria bacterium RIFCSPLOWO2_12_FULL_66_21]